MKKIHFLLLLPCLIALSGCNDFLELEPPTQIPNETAIQTAKDLETVLNGMYDRMQGGNVCGGNASGYSDLIADDALVNTSGLSNFGTNEIYFGNTSVQIGALRDMWRSSYAAINSANNIIYAIENNTVNDPLLTDATRNKMKAQALFARAFLHLQLCHFWALPYDLNKSGSNNQDGIVLRTEPTLNGPEGTAKPRSSVEEVYNQVIKDLENAYISFQTGAQLTSKTQSSAMAAQALLARVYLLKGDYEKAVQSATMVINSGSYTLMNKDNMLAAYQASGENPFTQGNLPEVIWQIVNIASDNSNAGIGFYRRSAGSPFFTSSFSPVPPYSLYTSSPNDTDYRKLLLYESAGPFVGTKKYTPLAGSVSSPNLRLLALPELYLIVAEADVRRSNTVTALADSCLNKLLKRVKQPYLPFSTSDVAQFLDKVLLERRLELAFENMDRYVTIRRLGLPLRDGSNNYAKYLFKIPQEEIAGNSSINQNP